MKNLIVFLTLIAALVLMAVMTTLYVIDIASLDALIIVGGYAAFGAGAVIWSIHKDVANCSNWKTA